MSVSIENTSGIPAAVWVIGLLILAAVVVYALRRGHNVKIGPIEFESQKDQPEKKSPPKTEEKLGLSPSELKKIDPAADPVQEGIGHLFGTTRDLDYELAFLYFRRAADAGQRDGIFYLGYMYEKGLHVPIDYQKAMSLFRRAAGQGSSLAMNNLGFMYENGLGVEPDFKTAVDWYFKAADLGEPAAHGNVGRMYKNGKGVPRDYEKALEYYRKGVSLGDDSSMNNLGVLYEDGLGVPQDLAQAIRLYKEAAENGNKSAARALERLKQSSPELF